MTDARELSELFRRNFPLAVREEEAVLRVLGHRDNRVLARRDASGRLMGAAVTRGDAVLLLCVDGAHRRQGLGAALLAETEGLIRAAGHRRVVVGAGEDYLTPGVPTSKRYCPAENEALYPGLTEEASRFFEKRGYRHSWDCNCFDMRLTLADWNPPAWRNGMALEGVVYRWAEPEDRAAACACVEDAWPEFTRYYKSESLYGGDPARRVMIAEADGLVAGALMVSLEAEGPGLGSVGCTAVRSAFRGRHIAVNLVRLSTAHLKASGMKDAFLGYTYSGLDHMYGYAGYKICAYYMMAQKRFEA